MRDIEFLKWLYDRLLYVHKENEDADFMHKLKAIINTIPENQRTPNIIEEK